MKKLTLNALTVGLILGVSSLVGCDSGTTAKSKSATLKAAKAETKTEKNLEEKTEKKAISGKEVFASKGCVACHQTETKTVGPALKEIAAAYKGNKTGLIAFLKEEGEAIVDPAQAAVMQPQLAVTKVLPKDELEAIADYMLSPN